IAEPALESARRRRVPPDAPTAPANALAAGYCPEPRETRCGRRPNAPARNSAPCRAFVRPRGCRVNGQPTLFAGRAVAWLLRFALDPRTGSRLAFRRSLVGRPRGVEAGHSRLQSFDGPRQPREGCDRSPLRLAHGVHE